MTDCGKFKKFIADKLSDNINIIDQKMLDEHLAKCEECSREYEEFRKLASLIAEMKLNAPQKLSDKARELIINTKQRRNGFSWLRVAAILVPICLVLYGMLLPAYNSARVKSRVSGGPSPSEGVWGESKQVGPGDMLMSVDRISPATGFQAESISSGASFEKKPLEAPAKSEMKRSQSQSADFSYRAAPALSSASEVKAKDSRFEKKQTAGKIQFDNDVPVTETSNVTTTQTSNVTVDSKHSISHEMAMPDSPNIKLNNSALKLPGVMASRIAEGNDAGMKKDVAKTGVDKESVKNEEIDISLDTDSDGAERKREETKSLKGRFAASSRNELLPMNRTLENAFSTFSISTDNASYVQARKLIMDGRVPPPEIIRPEDFINNFNYHYPAPPAGETFYCTMDSFSNVFRTQNRTLVVGLQGRTLGPGEDEKHKYTVLLDSSGSMAVNDRMFSALRAVSLLAGKLRPGDSMRVLVGGRMLITGNQTQIKNALANVRPGGVEFFADNLLNAYNDAERNFVSGARNRLVIITDSCRNLSPEKQKFLLERTKYYRKRDIANFVLGVGIEGDDSFLERLAAEGDGAFVGVDSADELQALFSEHFEARFREIAREVKIQVEFNPQVVASWRQVGYVKRRMAAQDFRNDSVDASAVGSGQCVTAVYELTLRPDIASDDMWAARTRFRYQLPGQPGRDEREYLLSAADLKKQWKDGAPASQLAALAGEFAESLAHPNNSAFSPSRVILDHLTRLRQTRMPEDRQILELEEMLRRSK